MPISEADIVDDAVKGRAVARTVSLICACIALVAVLGIGGVVYNQVTQSSYTRTRADKQDQFRCEVDHKLHLPTDWCTP